MTKECLLDRHWKTPCIVSSTNNILLVLDIKQMQNDQSTIFENIPLFLPNLAWMVVMICGQGGKCQKASVDLPLPPIFCLPDQGKSQWKVFWGSNEKECMEKYFHWTPAFHKWSLLIIVTINHCVKVLINEHNLSCYQYSLMCFILYEIWQIEHPEKWGYMWHILRIFYLKYFID